MLDEAAQKRLAGGWAAQQVVDGMAVGLGTGSTAAWAVKALGERVSRGLRCTGVATSSTTEALAVSLGIPMRALDELGELDLAIDGADEVDPQLDLIKGAGGALLREKLVELAARDLLIIVDEGKLVTALGERAAVPVEIVQFAWQRTLAALERLGGQALLRRTPVAPFLTDGGHYIVDCRFGRLAEPAALAATIKALPGVVEHGLFLGMAAQVAVGRADGSVQVLQRAAAEGPAAAVQP